MEETTPVLSVQRVLSGLCPPACSAMATAVRRACQAPSASASNTSAKAKCPLPWATKSLPLNTAKPYPAFELHLFGFEPSEYATMSSGGFLSSHSWKSSAALSLLRPIVGVSWEEPL